MSIQEWRACALILSVVIVANAQADEATAASPQTLGVITVTATAPSSLPSEIPTTTREISGGEVARTVNAADAEDAIRYFPSLLVRKRYIGDYNHAVLSSRASGTGNSARSAVYADGVLLSNYLGNGATFAPRWALVTPEEIERVAVMYGPFSAAYPGNSAGAIVDFVTRMPDRLEMHVGASLAVQPFRLYETDDTFVAHQESASIGDRNGRWSWWLNTNHTDSHGQPLTFPTRLVSAGAVGSAGTPVTGAVLDRDRSNNPWYLLGTATGYRTLQEHGKVKLAYDFSPTLRASYVLGVWQNRSRNRPASYLRDASGNPVYSDTVSIAGRSFPLAASDFNLSDESFTHLTQGLSVKQSSGGRWDWELAASRYQFHRDQVRQATTVLPAAGIGGAGTITDQKGTGWNTLALKSIWRPGSNRAHVFDFGYQQDRYRLHVLKSNIAGNWRYDSAGSVNTDVGGETQTRSLYVQDAWTLSPSWMTALGARLEKWQADDGFTATSSARLAYASRDATYLSPKAALSYQVDDRTVLKVSVGRAVRMPTVTELYGATSGVLTVINDPNLRPEKSWTGELTLEHAAAGVRLRATGFFETVRDSLYSARTVVGTTDVSRIVNVGRITTPGVELALQGNDWPAPRLNWQASVTWADSRIRDNSSYVTIPGDTIGKHQPRVPEWRATGQLDYRVNERWTAALGIRYSGAQFSTLDNSDPNGYAYQGASPYITADARVRWQFAAGWHAAIGVDNLNNYQYWNFHPYPQRTYQAELRWEL